MPAWRMQTTWPQGHPWLQTAQKIADRVALWSSGSFTITVYPDGGIVSATASFDAVSSGTVEAMHDWPAYWRARSRAFDLFGSVPFGYDNVGYASWFYAGGGQGLADWFYGQWNLVPFPAGNGGQALAVMSTKPLDHGLEDLVGLRMRVAGTMIDLAPMFGVIPNFIPGSQILSALASGTIDAVEFASPSVNYAMGFHQYTKYAIVPGFQKPGVQLMVTANSGAYAALTELEKVVLAQACQAAQYDEIMNSDMQDAAAIVQMRAAGVRFVTIPKEYLVFLRKTIKPYMTSLRTDEQFRIIHDSYEAHMAHVADWRKLRMNVATWSYRDYMRGFHTE